jgi:hypothetical protein
LPTKTTAPETAETEKAAVVSFNKEQILSAKKYADRRDLLTVLLSDDRAYTLAEVDQLIENFMKKEVK